MSVAKTDWKEAKGTVASVLESHSKGGNIYEVVFTYTVDGSYFGGTFTTMAYHREGETLPVRYNPSNPEENNFTKREAILRWVYVVFFVLMGLLAVYLFLQPKAK
jgi:hypothetical protein